MAHGIFKQTIQVQRARQVQNFFGKHQQRVSPNDIAGYLNILREEKLILKNKIPPYEFKPNFVAESISQNIFNAPIQILFNENFFGNVDFEIDGL